jgi:Flp pilus assembly protein TadG
MDIKNQKGAAIVEFAIILPVLIIFVIGIIEGSLLFYNKQIITNASREGARAGIAKVDKYGTTVDGTYIDTLVKAYCKQHLITFGGSKIPNSNTNISGSGSYPDGTITVTVNFPYNILVASAIGWSSSINLRAITVMNMF